MVMSCLESCRCECVRETEMQVRKAATALDAVLWLMMSGAQMGLYAGLSIGSCAHESESLAVLKEQQGATYKEEDQYFTNTTERSEEAQG